MPRGAIIPGLLLVLFGLWLFDPDTPTSAYPRTSQASTEEIAPRELAAIDGDTVRRGEETIRLIGFDTPETYRAQCDTERAKGEAATARLQELLRQASQAQLSYLPRRDQYGRSLARLMLDGEDVADILVSEGLARRYSGGQRAPWC